MAKQKLSQSRSPGRPSSEHASSTREDLLVSAINLFGDRGFDGISLSQIANEAGTDVGLTRYYFGSKSDLWKSAMDHLANQFTSELGQLQIDERTSKTETMKVVIRWFVDMSARWPQLSRIIVFDGNTDGERGQYVAERLIKPFYVLVGQLIEGAKAEGTIVDVAPRTIFFMITHGGSFPMALPELTNKFPGGDIGSPGNLKKHADAIIALIFNQNTGGK